MDAKEPGPGREPIDAVYTWVNGEDPDVRAALARWREDPFDPSSAGARRFRDNGELRHSLRSLERHAPWIRNVFVVHTGGIPPWMETERPDLRTVRQEEIFPDPAVLPVLNSFAIELCLHRIPGLSRRFLYLNDDFFLARDTGPEWFLPQGERPRFFFEASPIPSREGSRTVTDAACANTLRQQTWKGSHRSPALVPSRTGWRRLLGIQPRSNNAAHVPQMYDRDAIGDLERRFPGQFRSTRGHRFRSADDVSLAILYAHSGLARRQLQAVLLRYGSPDFLFLGLANDPARNRRGLARLERDRPRLVCVNDDVDSEAPDPPAIEEWKAVMERCWPRPSRYERSPVPVPPASRAGA